MSTFNELEQQTIKEHCGDWVLYSVDELEAQLAAERAKVAEMAVAVKNARDALFTAYEQNARCLNGSAEQTCKAAYNSIRDTSSMVAAHDVEIRRQVARGCAEIAEQYQRDQNGNAIMVEGRNISDEYELRAQGAFMVANAIRAKFGVKP